MNIRDIFRQTLRTLNRRTHRRPPQLAVTQLEDRVNPAPLQFFYVPMPETQVNAAFEAIIDPTTANNVSRVQDSFTVITVTENNTRVWYDQYEDGYEAILGTPQQSTTQLWGDGNNANGIAPGFANDPTGLASGTVLQLRNLVNVPRDLAGQPLLFDSPDRFGADRTVAVSRAQFPTQVNGGGGSVIASAVEVRDTRFADTRFTAPVGTDTAGATRTGEQSMFSYAAFYVQAIADNTRVQIDANNDGDFTDPDDRDVVLGQGQTVVSGQNVLEGGRVVASTLVQANLLTGQINGVYSSRTYALFSDNQRANDYFTPVGFGGPGDDANQDDVRLFVYNPNATAIRVRPETSAGLGTAVLVGANSGAFFDVTTNTGTRLFAVDAAGNPTADTFLALGVHDGPSGNTATTHDWGFNLQPRAALSQIAIVGLGVGNSNNPPSSGGGNLSPVFVTALVPTGQPNTQVFVDRNNDGTVDETLTLTRLQSVRLRDTTTNDNDNSGMRIFTTDGTLISVAWGEDGTAPDASPGLDAGTTVPAVPVPEYYKFSTFVPGPTGDVNGDGLFNEGDTVRYSLRIRNIGTTPISNAVVTDALPTGQVTYVAGTTTFTTTVGAVTTSGSIADSPTGTAFPLDGTGYTVLNLAAGQTTTIFFDARINTGLPAGFNFILNQSVLAYDIFRLPANDVIDLRGTVGDRVWYDVDGDGAQDAGEPGIPGATVTLTWYGPDGLPGGTDNQTFTATTGANGIWSITNLPAGTFATSATVPAGLGLTAQTAGPTTITLPSGQVNRSDVDFGFRGTGRIGDFVWADTDADGVQDAGEPGLAGATVTLTWAGFDGTLDTADDVIYPAVTTTGGTNNYGFSNLPAGNFRAAVTPPTGGTISPRDVGADTTDNDFDPTTGRTLTIALAAGATNLTVDAGIRMSADLRVTKTDGVTTAVPGTSVTYTITVTNAGPANVVGATLADTIPATLTGVTWTSAVNGTAAVTAGATGSGNSLAATVTLPTGAGNSVVFTVTGTVSAAATGSLVNTATITAPAGIFDTNTANNSETDTDTLTPRADLAITKDNGVAAVVPGTSVTYTIVVTNLGPSNVTGATIADTIPAALTGVTWTSTTAGTAAVTTGATGSSNSLAATVNIAAGAGNSVTFTVTGIVAAGATGTLTNTATVTAPGGVTDPTPGNNSATDTDPLTPRADLAITKTDGVTTAIPGQSVTYTIVVTNTGPSNVTGATITDSIPATLTGVSWTSATAGTAAVTAGATGSGNSLGATVNIAAGAGNSVTFTVTGTISPAATGSLTNTATVTAPGGVTDPTPGNNSATDTDTLTPRADLAITKDNGVAAVIPGTSVTYTIVVTNLGPSNVTGATIADTIPAALTGVSWTSATAGTAAVTAGATGSGNTLGATVNIAAGAGNSVTFTVTGIVAAGATGTLTNTATVTAPGGVTDPTPGNNSATDSDPLTPRADLAITKDNGVAAVVPGTSVTYTIVVTNTGPSNVTGATISDSIPATLTGVSWTSATAGTAAVTAGATGSGNSLGATVNIAAGAGNSVTFTVTGTISPAATGSLTNTATVTAPGGVTDPTPGNNSATDTDTLTPRADLAITKDNGVAAVIPGTSVTYTIVVTNLGPSNVTGATIADSIPATLTGVSWTSATAGTAAVTAGATGSGNSLGATVNIAAGAGNSVTFTVTGIVAAGATGTLTNTATVTAPGGVTDPTPGNNSATDSDPLTPRADLAITKDNGVAAVVPGTSVTYTIVVTNAGPSNVTGATVADLIPADLTGVTWLSSAAGTAAVTAGATGSGNSLGATVNIAAGAGNFVTFTVTGTLNSSFTGTLANTATVTAPGGVTDPTPGNNSASDSDPATPRADLVVIKSDGGATAVPGGLVTYTITVTNNGPSASGAITLTDSVPANTTFESATGGGSFAAGVVTWALASLAPNTSTQVTVTFRVAATVAANVTQLSNTASATGTATDPVPGNNSGGDTTPLDAAPDLRVTKTDPGTAAVPGGFVTYTITVFNDGNQNATGVTLTETVPANTVFIAAGSDAGWDPTGTTLGVGSLAAGASRSFTYQVRVDAPFPTGTSQITNVVDVADDGANGPDPTPLNNRATRNTPVAGGRIGDRVFLDANGNGIQDGGELGVQGVTVQLLDATTSAVLDTQVTDTAGTYQFVNLAGGTYRVSFGNTDGTRTFAFSAPAQGADPTADSDPAATGLTPVITLAAAELRDDIDAGVYVPVTIGDTVFFDADGNGTQAGEPGIVGVTVELYYAGPDGTFDPADLAAPFRTTITTAGGLYAFGGLAPGNYRVAVDATQAALAAVGMTSATTLGTQPTTMVSGVNDPARDFGFRGTGSLGDLVWLDRNGNGAQDSIASEPGLPRVAVGLTWLGFDGAVGGGDDVSYPGTLTDAGGLYGFANLPAGAFRVTVGPTGLPGDLTLTAGAPGVTLTPGQALTTADFGYRGAATIGDQVWYDVDGDGTRNNDEPGLPGVTVTVLSGGADGDLTTTADNFTVTATTDPDGRYSVAGLPGGSGTGLNYRVTVTPAAGYGVPTFDFDTTATPNASELRLGAGATNILQDFGYRGTGSIGDTVFEDRDGDGRFDAGEPGINGVTVRLYDATGTRLLAVTTTAGGGTYTFPGLAAGDYRVQFDTPAGYTPTVANRGTDDADSDAGAGGFTTTITVGTGAIVTDVDAGFYQPVSVGDRVWFDANGNGVEDGEPGVPGATVTLTWFGPDGAPNGGDDQTFPGVTTGTDGSWTVGSLPPGNYTAVVSGLPNGVTVPTADPDGTGTANTAAFTLTSGASRDDIDFGYAAAGSIGDRVWLDRDGNGAQDAGEPGLPGLTVTVTWLGFNGVPGGDDVTFPAVTTGTNGAYTVTGLPTGSFVVTVNPAGTNLVATSDPDGSSANGSATIVLTGGAPTTTAADFGFRGTASVGDLVFQDIDRDGALDTGELGLPGVAVTIRWAGGDGVLDTGDDATFTTTTDAAGLYTFAGLPVYGASDPYRVTIAAPAGYAATGDRDGLGTPNAATLNLGPTDAITDADFALGGVSGQSLAGSVYHDLNGDGDRDAGEPGLSGVTVRLSGTDAFGRTIVNPATGQPFFDTTTLGDGSYLFDFLVPGTYTLTEPVQPAAYGDGLEAAGTLNGTAGNDVISGIVLAAGAAGTGYTFGELGATISGTVFRDDDRDGTRTGTEPGIVGVVLTLQDAAGNPVTDPATGLPFTATTGPGGAYSFTNVPAGSYRIVETQPAGYANGPVGPATVRAVTLTPAGLTGQDFAEVLARVAGTVYVDRNANSALNGGEPGIGGVTVTLTGIDQFGTPVSLTTQTATDGTYAFDNLFPADAAGYTIDEGPVPTLNDGGPNLPGTAAGVAVGPNRFTGVAPVAGQQASGYNFAEVGVAVGGTVFVDLDRDGSRGPTDPPLANVVVELLDAGGAVVGTAVTGPDGAYLFTNVLPGTYTVREAQPAGYGNPPAGPSAPNTRPVTVAATPIGGLDFGDTLSSLSGTVYLDANRSGGREAGEAGIGGVVVTLTGTNAAGATVTRTTTTAADGGYRFDGVLAGTYTLTETQPTSFADGADAAGRVNAVSLGTVGNDVVSGIALAAGADYAGQLFGEEPPPAPTLGTTFLAGTVYRDANTNGVLDGGETGIAGVTVELRGPGGAVLQTAVTRADGTYLFLNVAPGTYTVAEPTQPAGLGSTTPDVLTVTVPAGPAPVVNVNFGEAPTSISGRAYLDLNASGTPDAGEPGLGGVLVTLTGTDTNGNPVSRSATTAGDGTFLFNDLAPGTYTVTETQPTGLPDGADLAGSHGVAGNDLVSAITLTAGAAATGIAFGELPAAGPGLSFVTGTVFIDADRDGTQDQGETPIPGVTVELLGPDGVTVVATTQTGPDGRYVFPDLPAGTYFVREVQPAGLASTSPNLLPVSITPASPATAVSFGEVAGSISGSVYQDLNLNGTRDPGEPGIGGAIVTLTGPGGLTRTATTDADGNYRFDGLPDGNYVLTEAQPAGYADGQDAAGNAGGTPAGGDSIPGITLTGGPAAAGYTFGELGTNSVSGTVYADINMNWVFDPAGGDFGLRPGILILLTGTDGGGNLITRSTRTAADGTYAFGSLPAGTYRIVEDQPSLPTTAIPPDGVYDGGDNPGTPGGSVAAKNQLAVTLTGDGARPPQNATEFNFGELPPADPFGFAFEDLNANGRFDAGEPGLPGVTVTISGTAFAGTPAARPLAPADAPNGLTITTDANGFYRFDPIPPGLFAITLTTGPAAPLALFRLENADPNLPAPTIGATAFTNIVQNPLPIRGALNFGFVRPVSLAGAVYLDANGNGARDAGDPGLGGVAVSLTGTDGLGAAVNLTTRTAADGSYSFPGLLPGVYAVTETQPANLFQGVNTPGTAGGTTAITDVIGAVTLTSGTAATGYLFGERPVAPIAATPLPPLAPLPETPAEASKRMFLTSTPDAVAVPATGRMVPDFAALGSVSTARNPEFFATAEGPGGDLIRVFDLTAGNERFRFRPFPGNPGGVRVAVADLTGDGIPDVAAAAGPGGAPRVVVYDGNTGGVLFDFLAFEAAFTGGVFVAAGDIDRDGRADLVVTPDVGGGPRARVLSAGNPGRVIADMFAIDDPNFRGGIRPAIGDVNGDGFGDLVVTAGAGGGPRVAVWDGASLAGAPARLVPDFFAFEETLRDGAYLAVGDVDRDGRADLIAGAGPGGAPRVVTFLAADLFAGRRVPAVSYMAGDVAERGGVPVAVADIDGDGRVEVVTGAGAGSFPQVRLSDPRTGRALDEFAAQYMAFRGGIFVG